MKIDLENDFELDSRRSDARTRPKKEYLRQSSNPLVSVIIPTFDAQEYIRQTLYSVLSQTYEAMEVIIVDDGSSDATIAIIQEFLERDPRFQLVSQSNAGVGAARNTAIRKAHGKYIAPLDADDIWFPEKLEKQVATMERWGDETGLVYCWSALIDEHDNFLDNGDQETMEGRLRYVLLLRNFIGNASAPLFSAAALEKVGLYLTRDEQDGAQGCEDWDLVLRIAEVFCVRVVPEFQLAYRQTNSSMSVQTHGMAESFEVVMVRARQRNCDLPSVAFRWSAGYFYLYLVQKCLLFGRHDQCLRYCKKAVGSNPVLLLTTGIYRTFLGSLLKVVLDPRANHLAGQLRPEPDKKEKHLVISQKTRLPFISNRIFSQIELKRWSAALSDGG